MLDDVLPPSAPGPRIASKRAVPMSESSQIKVAQACEGARRGAKVGGVRRSYTALVAAVARRSDAPLLQPKTPSKSARGLARSKHCVRATLCERTRSSQIKVDQACEGLCAESLPLYKDVVHRVHAVHPVHPFHKRGGSPLGEGFPKTSRTTLCLPCTSSQIKAVQASPFFAPAFILGKAWRAAAVISSSRSHLPPFAHVSPRSPSPSGGFAFLRPSFRC